MSAMVQIEVLGTFTGILHRPTPNFIDDLELRLKMVGVDPNAVACLMVSRLWKLFDNLQRVLCLTFIIHQVRYGFVFILAYSLVNIVLKNWFDVPLVAFISSRSDALSNVRGFAVFHRYAQRALGEKRRLLVPLLIVAHVLVHSVFELVSPAETIFFFFPMANSCYRMTHATKWQLETVAVWIYAVLCSCGVDTIPITLTPPNFPTTQSASTTPTIFLAILTGCFALQLGLFIVWYFLCRSAILLKNLSDYSRQP